MSKLTQVGDFCPNEACSDYGKLQKDQPKKNVKRFGKTRQAGKHAEALEEVLLAEYRVDRGQLDGLWSYVGNKGEKKAMPKRR